MEYNWIIKSFITVFIAAVIIVGIIGLAIGKVVEVSIWAEIAKWVILALVCGLMACLLAAPIIGALDHVRDQMYPMYQKKWFIQWIKNGFKVK